LIFDILIIITFKNIFRLKIYQNNIYLNLFSIPTYQNNKNTLKKQLILSKNIKNFEKQCLYIKNKQYFKNPRFYKNKYISITLLFIVYCCVTSSILKEKTRQEAILINWICLSVANYI